MPNNGNTVTVQQALDLAVQHHEASRLSQAENIYRQILERDSDQPDALHLLGVIAHQLGKNDEAYNLISKSISFRSDLAESHNNLGNVLRQLFRLDNAAESYREAIRLKPDFAQAHNNLGNALQDLDQLEAAMACYRQALLLMPKYSQAQYSLGVALHKSGKSIQAIASLKEALANSPDLAIAHRGLGNLLVELGREKEGIKSYHKALEFDPESAETYSNLGLALQGIGMLDQAVANYRKALSISPNFANAHYNLGNALLESGSMPESLTAYRKAVSSDPNFYSAYNNMGRVLLRLGEVDEAITFFQKALSIQPNYAKAHYNLGIIYRGLGKPDASILNLQKAIHFEPNFSDAHRHLALTFQDKGDIREAIRQIDKALSLEPENDGWKVLRALLLPVILSSQKEIDKVRKALAKSVTKLCELNLEITDPLSDSGITNFYLAYHDQNNKNLIESIANLHLTTCPGLTYKAKHCSSVDKNRKTMLRVGFLSSFFTNHTITKLTRGIIEHLSRDQFEVILFRSKGKESESSGVLDHSSDRTVLLMGKLEEDRERIEKESLDILFYPDIGMSAHTYFLSFSRLAPVQIVSWGHPDTTGVPNIDYFVSSNLLEDENTSTHYSEKLITLNTLPTFYFRPAKPEITCTRMDFGLPVDTRLYLCPQALFKFHPKFDGILGELLRRDTGGRLVLIDDDRSKNWNKLFLDRFQQSFPDVTSHVIFVSRMSEEQFFSLLSLADVILDIPSFSGGNTSLEAFAMGAPIVTCPGKFMRGRVTTGLYKQMGIPDLIAKDSESYLKLALKVAKNKQFRKIVSDKINANSHKLFERHDTVRELEIFFQQAYRAWQIDVALEDGATTTLAT